MKIVRPGCFGSFVLFSRSHITCNACPFNKECSVEACKTGTLAKVRLAETAPTAPKEIPFGELPVKVRPIVAKLSTSVTDIRSSMLNGRAVVCLPRYMATAFNELGAGFTKSRLKRVFITAYGWTEGTAASHASIAVSVIGALKLGSIDSKGEFQIDR